jgi:hypothetical protein
MSTATATPKMKAKDIRNANKARTAQQKAVRYRGEELADRASEFRGQGYKRDRNIKWF